MIEISRWSGVKFRNSPRRKFQQHFVGNGATCNASAGRKPKKSSSKRRIGAARSRMVIMRKMVVTSATARPPGVKRNQKFVNVNPRWYEMRSSKENEGVKKADFEEMSDKHKN